MWLAYWNVQSSVSRKVISYFEPPWYLFFLGPCMYRQSLILTWEQAFYVEAIALAKLVTICICVA